MVAVIINKALLQATWLEVHTEFPQEVLASVLAGSWVAIEHLKLYFQIKLPHYKIRKDLHKEFFGFYTFWINIL